MSSPDKLADQRLSGYLSDLAAKKSTPGGGAVAAIAAAEACALISMVANFTSGDIVAGMSERAGESIARLLQLADEDADAFDAVMAAYRDKSAPPETLQKALEGAARVPQAVIDCCKSHIDDLELLVEHGNQNLATDVAIAASMLETAINASELNILVNARSMDDASELTAGLPDLEDHRTRLRRVFEKIHTGLS